MVSYILRLRSLLLLDLLRLWVFNYRERLQELLDLEINGIALLRLQKLVLIHSRRVNPAAELILIELAWHLGE